MHHSRQHYGIVVYGGELTDKDWAFIDVTAIVFLNEKKVNKLDSLKRQYDLPSNGWFIIQHMGGVFRVIAFKTQKTDKKIKYDYEPTLDVPMLYSGVFLKSTVRHGEPVTLQITDTTRRRLAQYQDERKPHNVLDLQRFVVDYNDHFQEFRPRIPLAYQHTQYTKQRPTWYSGAMANVMQVVGGYGSQKFDELPDNPYERAMLALPKETVQEGALELVDALLPAYHGEPDKEGKFWYDYKFNHCHAVSISGNGTPWLLSISAKGVYAMPLPIIPMTATQAFRDFIIAKNDDEILRILDGFGAMPSGEPFPQKKEDFEAWERAGVITKVCDTKEFYQNIPYYAACGWSFNTIGTDGYNTCYSYGGDGIINGYTYNMTCRMGDLDNHGWLTQGVQRKLKGEDANKVARYLAKILSAVGRSGAKSAAIRYKLERSSDEELLQRADNGESDVDYWDNLVMPPIAKNSVSLRRVFDGKLYHPSRFESQPQIKFPLVEMDGCQSFDFSQLEGYPAPSEHPYCDTVMFAYFADDDLKVVRYFYMQQHFQSEKQSTFEEYMTVGKWEETIRGGNSELDGHFIHTDIDDIREVSESFSHVEIVGEDKGFDTKPWFAIFEYGHMQGAITRTRYYTHETKTLRYGRESVDIALCVPFYCRDSILYAFRDFKENVQTGHFLNVDSVRDPYVYYYWMYDDAFHWRGGARPPAKGQPPSRNGVPVWVEDFSYNPHPANAFADNGPWIDGLPADYTWLVHPQHNVWYMSGGGGPPHIETFHHTNSEGDVSEGYLSLSMKLQPNKIFEEVKKIDSWYFLVSPDKNGNYFYRDAIKNRMGTSLYYNVSEMVEKKRKAWGNSQFVNSLDSSKAFAYHFVGVIN